MLGSSKSSRNLLLAPPDVDRLRRLQATGRLPGRQVLPLIIPPECCFVLGDNATVSEDSRSFGPIPIGAILGRAML